MQNNGKMTVIMAATGELLIRLKSAQIWRRLEEDFPNIAKNSFDMQI